MVLRRIRRTVTSRVDPLGWGPATASVALRAAMNPLGVIRANAALAANLARIPLSAATMYTGGQVAPPLTVDAKDKRFADPAWTQNPGYVALRQSYLAVSKYVDDLLEAGHGDPLSDGKAKQLSDLLLGALAPTSFAVTNPDVLVEAYRTGGRSLAKGARFAASDMITRGGRPVKVER